MGRNWSIVVGIDNYDNLQMLKYARRDAEAMAGWFKEEAKFEQVFLFTDDSLPIASNPPIPTQPTHARFLRFLNAQFERPLLKPEDNLWFFFAGHGKRYADQDYLMFLDSDPQAVDRTAISVEYVTQRLRRSGADNVVLLIDACRDEGERGGLGVGMDEYPGVITFYSCTANQKSWEIDELKHGSFTYTLLEGLRLRGEFNCVTVERLDQYLRYNVPQLNSDYRKAKQNPYLKAEPPYKMYFILLEQAARLKDVEPLKYQASLAENRGELSLARQLWVRVLAVSRGDWDAVNAIERIALRQSEPIISSSESISLPTGKRSVTSKPVSASSAPYKVTQAQINRRQFLKWTGGFGGVSLVIAVAVRQIFQALNPKSISLQSFNFVVVTVDERGKEVNRRPGKAKFFTEYLGNGVTLEMVSILTDYFKMGSPIEEKSRNQNEGVQRTVYVPAFFMGKFQVTQKQYQQVIGSNPSNSKGAQLPVEGVSWNDAVEFCKKLSQKTGKDYRLSSEAEWEYACRAGTTTPFHFGETITTELANYNGNNIYAYAPKGKYPQQTTEVGSFPPNAFGLYDMHGNVWEWCQDTWHDNYNGAPIDGSAWVNTDNSYRILRGGSWSSNPEICRSALRNKDNPDSTYNDVGFRVVLSNSVKDENLNK